jgi:hypothetical protein
MTEKSKNIFREIHQDEDCTDIVIRCMICVAIGGAVIILLISGWSMMQSAVIQEAENARYQKELRQMEADPVWQAEQRCLKKKHGDYIVTYKPGQVPFYHCGPDGKAKCKYL